MNAKKSERTKTCSRRDALQFLERASAHLEAIELLEGGYPDSAANLAVSVAINASDAVCCARLGEHSQGSDHRAAVALLGTVSPGGADMAKDLERILRNKYAAEYRQTSLSASNAKNIIKWARRLLTAALAAVDLGS